jgi:hypothetical protein
MAAILTSFSPQWRSIFSALAGRNSAFSPRAVSYPQNFAEAEPPGFTADTVAAPANISAATADNWPLPVALLRPLAQLFDSTEPSAGENFLAGLSAEELLGAKALAVGAHRQTPLAWVGVALRAGERGLFADLRGGCWMRGFPVIGRGRELLRAAGLGNAAGLTETLRELGLPGAPGAALYFNFHYNEPAAGCERVYVLDADARRLHGFASPTSALAPGRGK